MIKCPQCQAALPDGWTKCQFCGAEFALQAPQPPASGASPEEEPELKIAPAPTWAAAAVRAVAIWWIINGGWTAISALIHGSSLAGLLVPLNLLTALVGVGVLRQAPIARTVVNVICWLQIFNGVISFLLGFLAVSGAVLYGMFAMLFAVLQTGVAALMIYLMAETDMNGPGF